MLGRVCSGLVITFWVAMMASLVRVEFFPEPSALSEVPPELVLRRIFSQETSRLHVLYQDEDIGMCTVDITPLVPEPATNGPATGPATGSAAYRVHSELTLMLQMFGMPSRLRLVGDSLFTKTYEIDSFHIRTTIGEGQVEVRGDAVSNKVQVDFVVGDRREQRSFDFRQVQGAGLASALGLPGLANFSFLGGGGLPTAFPAGGTGAQGSPKPNTTIVMSSLEVGDVSQRAYLVESKLDQSMWARMWISQRGEVLKVETSVGITMLADVLSPLPTERRAARHHDPH